MVDDDDIVFVVAIPAARLNLESRFKEVGVDGRRFP